MPRWIVYGTISTEVEADTYEEACEIGNSYLHEETHPDYSLEAEQIDED